MLRLLCRAQSASEAMNYLNPNNFKLHINTCGSLLIRLTTSPSRTCTAVCNVRASPPPVGTPHRTAWCDLMWSGLMQIIPSDSQSRVSSDEIKCLNKCMRFSTRANQTALVWLTCHLKYLEHIKEPEGFIAQQEETTYHQLIYPQELSFVKTEESGGGNSTTRSSVSNEAIPDCSFTCDAWRFHNIWFVE